MADAIHHVQEFEPHFLSSVTNHSFTMFAPTNDAFEKLGKDNLHSLMKNRKKLKKMVQNHVVDNMFANGLHPHKVAVQCADRVPDSEGTQGERRPDGQLGHVIEPDVVTRDGIVHCIDQVLVPERRRRKS
ncbi:transforming growth factor-beta-induced protein ig-h3 [Trichonephila clavata]|uniref:Transforming growth factor-beta-induced protein ig-h3 n=1 Tax=Trichonephila clavata TaxID=2740835 RepID=A0A8X6GW88_TRICU|nr:transforming growth factor-beta-induced protein ig-h3 [Trichonephila clavata]